MNTYRKKQLKSEEKSAQNACCFRERTAADGLVLLKENQFEICAFFIGCDKRFPFHKPCIPGQQAPDAFKIIQVVGGKMDATAGHQGGIERIQEGGVKQPAPMMPAFRPGIGKKNVIGGN